MEGEAFALEFGCGMAVAVAAYGAQADGQDMAQVAGNKLHTRNGFGSLGITTGAVFPRKGDRRFADSQDAGVGDGRPANIPAQILDDALAVAEGLEMHTPIFFPDGGIHAGQGGLFRALAQSLELLLKEMPESGAEHGLGHKEAGAFNSHHAALTVEPRSRNDAMNVRMKMKTLVPCVQDHGKPAAVGAQPAGIGQGVGKRLGGCRKKDFVDRLDRGSEKQSPKLLRQGEGHHEVGSANALCEFALDPVRGILFAALRTRAVVAGMKRKVGGSAFFAGVDMPAHRRRAAVGERPDGATPCPIPYGMHPQEIRQKTAQRPDHSGFRGHGVRVWVARITSAGRWSVFQRDGGYPDRCDGSHEDRSWWS